MACIILVSCVHMCVIEHLHSGTLLIGVAHALVRHEDLTTGSNLALLLLENTLIPSIHMDSPHWICQIVIIIKGHGPFS